MWGAIAGAGLQLAGNIFSGIQGARLGKKQMGLGQDMIDEAQKLSAAYQRPEMQTPEAIRMMMELSQGRQFQNLPGMNIAQNQLGQSTASGMSAINEMSSGSEGIGAIANLYANQMRGGQDLAMKNAQYQDQNQQQYLGALEGLGNWQQKAWQWNKADPYLMAQEKAAQLEMMGRQGQWEGMKNKMGSWGETFAGAGRSLGNSLIGMDARMRAYHNDPFIKGCLKQLEKVVSCAKPYIAISPSSDIGKCKFDIDEGSKKSIQYWKDKIEDYVSYEYSDLITKTSKKIFK